ncbi:MAG: hypothetical protein WC848_01800 [Parcubacteria group bacterium]|jgi:hypothetical protein
MSIDNQNKPKDGKVESFKAPEAKAEELLRMEDDPQFNQILQEESLDWLKTQNKEYFNREFTGALDEKGYLIGKDVDSSTKPFQNIGGGKPMLEVLEHAKKRFVREFSQQATKYPETAALAKKHGLSKGEQQLVGSIEKDTVEIKKARKRLGISDENVEKAPSISAANKELEKNKIRQIEVEEEIKKQEEKQGELMESFLNREYGETKSPIDRIIEEKPGSQIGEHLADRPEDKDNELKVEIEERTENANQTGKPLEEEQEDRLRQEVVGGPEQAIIKEKEAEASVVRDVEQDNFHEIENKENGENSEQKSAEVALEKIRMYEFSGYARDLANTLRRRESDNLSPIIDPRTIGYLSHAADDLKDMLRNKKSKPEDVERTIMGVVAAINTIGKDSSRIGMIRDNSDSLRRVAYGIRNLGESSRNIMIQLGGMEDTNTKGVVGSFGQLINLTEKGWRYALRKAEMLENR